MKKMQTKKCIYLIFILIQFFFACKCKEITLENTNTALLKYGMNFHEYSEELWRVSTNSYLLNLMLIDETNVLLSNFDGDIYILNFEGEIEHYINIVSPIFSKPIIIEDLLLIIDSSGKFRIFKLNNLDEISSTMFFLSGVVYTPLLYDGINLYSASDSGFFLSKPFSKNDNLIYNESKWERNFAYNIFWRKNKGYSFISSTSIIDNSVVLGTKEGKLCRVDLNNGRKKWVFETTEMFFSNSFLTDQNLYAACLDGFLYKIDFKNGNCIWKFNAMSPIKSEPAMKNGLIYFGSMDGVLYCINSLSGDLVWKSQCGNGFYKKVTFINDVVLVGCLDGNLYCFDQLSGDCNWIFKADSGIVTTPIYNNDQVIFGCEDGTIYCIQMH